MPTFPFGCGHGSFFFWFPGLFFFKRRDFRREDEDMLMNEATFEGQVVAERGALLDLHRRLLNRKKSWRTPSLI